MTEFSIIVDGKEYMGELITFAYSYKVSFSIDGVRADFEPDDEGNFRAIVEQSQIKMVRPEVLEAIAKELKAGLS